MMSEKWLKSAESHVWSFTDDIDVILLQIYTWKWENFLNTSMWRWCIRGLTSVERHAQKTSLKLSLAASVLSLDYFSFIKQLQGDSLRFLRRHPSKLYTPVVSTPCTYQHIQPGNQEVKVISHRIFLISISRKLAAYYDKKEQINRLSAESADFQSVPSNISSLVLVSVNWMS